jgi:hypothetical protein
MKNITTLLFLVFSLSLKGQTWQTQFKTPPMQYRPIPLWHINGKMTFEETTRQLKDVRDAMGFGGVMVLPVTEQTGITNRIVYPATEPEYLTDGYFAQYEHILKTSKELGMNVVWYDDIDFPSGAAGKRMKATFPNDVRKILSKLDTAVAANTTVALTLPKGTLLAAVAMNTQTKERQDLTPSVKDGKLTWTAPADNWKLMIFTCDTWDSNRSNDIVVDYLDPQAIDKYFTLNHQEFEKRLKPYFGTTITQIYIDDIGFYTGGKHGEKTWTARFNEKFKSYIGKNPATYYPALWEDIGAETQAARVAFYDTRAELLAEGFPRKTAEWATKMGIQSTGHPPGNYEIQPVDMNADIFKFYRHQHIPLMDLIFFYGHGREGYKLVSSAANLYDKPVVGCEIYGAMTLFKKEEKMTPDMLYKCAMEVFTRGVNELKPHGMWYNPDLKKIRIPPLIASYNPDIAAALPDYSTWSARSTMLLQGGQTVSDIAVFYPIAALQGYYYFDAEKNEGWGKFAAPEHDYLRVSDMLTNEIHRDFTFIHPESLMNGKISVGKAEMILNNKENKQNYKVLILSGGKVISTKALLKIKEFYEKGGKIIATSMLPTQAAEFGEDPSVKSIINAIFSTNPSILQSNKAGGKAIFIEKPTAENLRQTLEMMSVQADVVFDKNIAPLSNGGMLSYIHKRKDGKDLYYFANSTGENIETMVEVRGKMTPQYFDPHTGEKTEAQKMSYVKKGNHVYTRFELTLGAVETLFVVSK